MSKSDILYVRGMNMSDVECPTSEADVMWDDTQLTSAYDKALKMANIGVAQRLAMATNSLKRQSSNSKQQPKQQHSRSKADKKKKWSVGDSCRAVYEGDGREYEAFIQRIINDKECVVKFLGYGNTEIVSMDSMKPSHGRDAQQLQIEQADRDDSECSPAHTMDLGSDRGRSPDSMDRSGTDGSFPRRERKKKKRDPFVTINGFELPDLSPAAMHLPVPPVPNFTKLRNLRGMDIPLPSMIPPFPCSDRIDNEESAVSSMLLSWYMSGYYTGLYQGMKRSRDNKRRKD